MHMERTDQEGHGVKAGLHKGTKGVETETLFGKHVRPRVPFPILNREPFGNRERFRGYMSLDPFYLSNPISVSKDIIRQVRIGFWVLAPGTALQP